MSSQTGVTPELIQALLNRGIAARDTGQGRYVQSSQSSAHSLMHFYRPIEELLRTYGVLPIPRMLNNY